MAAFCCEVRAAADGVDDFRRHTFWAVVYRINGAYICHAMSHKIQAVGFRFGTGHFVGIDAISEFDNLHKTENALEHLLPPRIRVIYFVGIEGRRIIPDEYACACPFLEHGSGTSILVAAFSIPGQFLAEIYTNDIVRTLLVKHIFIFGRYHIVGRCDDIVTRNLFAVKEKASEWTYFRHLMDFP